MEKLSSMKPVPGAKKVGDHCLRGSGLWLSDMREGLKKQGVHSRLDAVRKQGQFYNRVSRNLTYGQGKLVKKEQLQKRQEFFCFHFKLMGSLPGPENSIDSKGNESKHWSSPIKGKRRGQEVVLWGFFVFF